MTWAWFEESGLILQDGGIILCDECPCVITGTGTTGTGTIDTGTEPSGTSSATPEGTCEWCPEGEGSDNYVVEFSGISIYIGDKWCNDETGSGTEERCPCWELNGSHIFYWDWVCQYLHLFNDKGGDTDPYWCKRIDPSGYPFRWYIGSNDGWGHTRLQIKEGSTPGTWKFYMSFAIECTAVWFPSARAYRKEYIFESEDLTINCQDADGIPLSLVQKECVEGDEDPVDCDNLTYDYQQCDFDSMSIVVSSA